MPPSFSWFKMYDQSSINYRPVTDITMFVQLQNSHITNQRVTDHAQVTCGKGNRDLTIIKAVTVALNERDEDLIIGPIPTRSQLQATPLLRIAFFIIAELPLELQLMVYKHYISENYSLHQLYKLLKQRSDQLLATALASLLMESTFLLKHDFETLSCDFRSKEFLKLNFEPADYVFSLYEFLTIRNIKAKRVVISVYRDLVYPPKAYEKVSLLQDCFEDVHLNVKQNESYHSDFCTFKNLHPFVTEIRCKCQFPWDCNLTMSFPKLEKIHLVIGSDWSTHFIGNSHSLKDWLSASIGRKLILDFVNIDVFPDNLIEMLNEIDTDKIDLDMRYRNDKTSFHKIEDFMNHNTHLLKLKKYNDNITLLHYYSHIESSEIIKTVTCCTNLRSLSINHTSNEPHMKPNSMTPNLYESSFHLNGMKQLQILKLAQLKLTSDFINCLPESLRHLEISNCGFPSSKQSIVIPADLETLSISVTSQASGEQENFFPTLSNVSRLKLLTSVSLSISSDVNFNKKPSDIHQSVQRFVNTLPSSLYSLKLHIWPTFTTNNNFQKSPILFTEQISLTNLTHLQKLTIKSNIPSKTLDFTKILPDQLKFFYCAIPCAGKIEIDRLPQYLDHSKASFFDGVFVYSSESITMNGTGAGLGLVDRGLA
ncbi:unnamed protein product [Ambrosiozyma monospora]|uniref:Unnamed protein product n=1 Tax=Ambrosiozyma monospora TaxID=43982 RepID=A0A9W6YTH3_AMBMO|nr:unnamed protein product [Ambrosiozyma monospora]